jgi:hypothetical protein
MRVAIALSWVPGEPPSTGMAEPISSIVRRSPFSMH